MLRESFIFLPRVSYRTEQRIWKHADDWNSFLSAKNMPRMSKKTKKGHDQSVNRAKAALRKDDHKSLARIFPGKEHWRLYQHFRNETAFLDIETGPYGDVSMVGIFDGKQTKQFVQGINLDRKTLSDELSNYKSLVTFNGKSFDVPMLKKWFKLPFEMPHIDLMHVCHRVGLSGGLKSIEKQMDIKRPKILTYVTGEDAAELWRCWKATGDREFFDMLLSYNEEDCVNLQRIADVTVPKLWNSLKQQYY